MPMGESCQGCLAGFLAFLDLLDGLDSRNGHSQSPSACPSLPVAEILSTELPPGWGRNGGSPSKPPKRYEEAASSRSGSKGLSMPSIKGSKGLSMLKVVTSMPSFLEFITDDPPAPEEPSSPGLRREAAIQEQCVELGRLLINGSSAGEEATSSASVVFEHKHPDLATEFVLQVTERSWFLPFNQTKLPAGMYKFYFVVDGVRTLSSVYPVIGGLNVAIFSDALRRYIVGHGKAISISEDETFEPPCAWTRHSTPDLDTPPKESGMMRRKVVSCQSLQQLEAIAESPKEAASLSTVLQDRRTPNALFPKHVFDGLYDNELTLRLHPSVLRGLDLAAAQPGTGNSMRLWAGSARMGKQHGQCEDACFVSTSAVGVADGVGGMAAYKSYGVNSAQLALELMQRADAACHAMQDDQPDRPPQECAREAIMKAERSAQSFGASTIAVAVMKNSELGVANLGDSGFMILRRGKHRLEIVARSIEQHHRWNCPYQLTRLPPALSKKFPGFACDTPQDADMYCTAIQEGDLLLLFTDGLKDNLHDCEIRNVTECALPPGVSHLVGLPEYKTAPDDIAKALALAAYERSCDPTAMVPFSKGCRKNGYEYVGGKEDDITVVAAWVLQDAPAVAV